MSTGPFPEDNLVKVLNDFEDEIVLELSGVCPRTLSMELFEACIITHDSYDRFNAINHEKVDLQLQIRYLLRLICENINEVIAAPAVWDKVLVTLSTGGENSNRLKNRLVRLVSGRHLDIAAVNTVADQSSMVEINSDHGVERESITLSNGDINLLTELLVEVSHKWEEIAVSLGLLEFEIAECRRHANNKIRLHKVISCWMTKETIIALKELVKALTCNMVGVSRFAQDFEKKVIEAKIQSNNAKKCLTSKKNPYSNNIFTISKIPQRLVEVADGKSTLLHVQTSSKGSVSYQWKKDGQSLANCSTYSGVDSDLLVVSHARQGTEGEYTCCCVSREGEVCSNKICLTVTYPPAKKVLLNLYSIKKEIPVGSWPPVVTERFINLALIKSNARNLGSCDYSVRGDADDIIAAKETVEYEELCKYKSTEFLLLEGRPGSGKTTLVHKVVKDWTRGTVLTNANLVFLVALRVLNSEKGNETLPELLELFYTNKKEIESLTNDIHACDGEGTCFILDGLDEYQLKSKKASFVSKLLNREYLTQSMIIVTSRPIAITELSSDIPKSRIEVLGFSKQQIFKYIDSFPFTHLSNSSPTSPTETECLKDYLMSNPNIFDMCYLPVHAAMICFIYDCDRKHIISCTQTKIYEQFSLLMIHRHLKKHGIETDIKSLNDLHGIHRKYFEDLCNLAFKMTTESKHVISAVDLDVEFSQCDGQYDEYSLGLVTIYNTIHLTAHHRSYAFLHLTFQEFLAAFHIANGKSASQQLSAIQLYSEKKDMLMVWMFYFGLMKFKHGSKRLKRLIFYDDKTFTLVAKVNALCNALESQQKVVCDEVVKLAQGSLEYYLNTSTPTDLQAIGYLISTTSQTITELSLCKYHREDDRIDMLLEQISNANLHDLKILRIPFIISGNGMCNLANILKSNFGLCGLSLNIKDDTSNGSEDLYDQIGRLTNLQMFSLHYSSSNPSSIGTLLVHGIKHLTRAKLILTFVNINMELALALGRGLNFCMSTNLHTLRLVKSNLGAEGAVGVFDGLQHHTMLYELNLSNCNIRLGASHLTGGLQLTNLHILNLSHNSIDSECAACLANTFERFLQLEWLSLSHNNIGPEGMKHLATGLVFLTKIRWLYLSHNNIDLEAATAVISSLRECHNLWTAIINVQKENYKGRGFVLHNLVSSNNTAAIADLVAAAQSQNRERILDLGFNKIEIPPRSVFWRVFYKMFANMGYTYILK